MRQTDGLQHLTRPATEGQRIIKRMCCVTDCVRGLRQHTGPLHILLPLRAQHRRALRVEQHVILDTDIYRHQQQHSTANIGTEHRENTVIRR